jgi:hypothetical protein
MSTQTMPMPVTDERTLEQLEVEFLLGPDPFPTPQQLDLAELLAPAIGQVDDDPACRVTRVRTGKACCD